MKLLVNKTRTTRKVKTQKTLREILEPIVIPIADKSFREFQFLDKLVDEEPLCGVSIAYGLLKIASSGKRPELIKEVISRLYARMEPVIQGERAKLDVESEVLPVVEMAAFLSGLNL